jgi:hypothetical protein
MKAPIAQAGGEAASPPGCAFLFFWGLELVKFFLLLMVLLASTAIRKVRNLFYLLALYISFSGLCLVPPLLASPFFWGKNKIKKDKKKSKT